VPGATVRLAGTYALRAETLDFHGSLLMDAKVSRAAGGVKGALLKLVDPLFDRKGGGSRIPIKVTGKRDDPSFGLDVKRVLGGD